MRYYLAVSFCLLLHCGFTQNTKIDSINNLIRKEQSDTTRINLINRKIDFLSSVNLDSAIILGEQNAQSAQKINFYQGELDARVKLSTNYCYKGNYAAAEQQFIFLAGFIKPHDSVSLADLYTNRGLMYGMQSRYDSSIKLSEKAIGIYERHNILNSLADVYTNIAIGYQQLSNFPKALEYEQKSLKLAESLNDETSQAYTLLNLANTYQNIGDSAKAEQAFLKSVNLALKKDLKNVELYGYSNLSSLYSAYEQWNKSYQYGMKAANLATEFGDQGIKAASLSKAALALAKLNKIKEAIALNRQAILVADSSNQQLNISQAQSAMGEIYYLDKDYKTAIVHYEKSFDALSGSDIYLEAYAEAYKNLSSCYEFTGDYKKALLNHKLFASITDSVRRKDNVRKATELSMNYDFEKKQAIAKAEQDKKDEKAKRIKNQQLFIIFALAIAVLAVVVIAIIQFRNSRHKQKANLLLRREKQKAESTLSELKSTQAQLIQSEKMASLGELTAGIAHEIQNPLNFVNNFSEVNEELITELIDEIDNNNIPEVKAIAADLQQNLSKINYHGKRADAIVKGMLQHSRKSSGAKEPTDINALCDEYLRLSYHGLRAKDKNFNAEFKTSLDENAGKINIIPQDIGRVLLNLFNNAFYAVNERRKNEGEKFKALISVATQRVHNSPSGNESIEIKVIDNGNGIPQNVINKIFQPFFTTKPTGEGTGLGLSLTYDIITKQHNGTINVESKEGEGTTFIITLPV
ncbi:tetratricopeptide repeat protein [Parafilimonas terrae]|uniref:histidine kinase n=1 Tax=Parafilimonas terrae TaxID=1465490 RepID=A0A1I5Z6Q1_9BACT|nr:tetratricopeptide repeat protein [Parafilimonas terrae]SFQ52134.1 Tetratricopeptide repeat-containing protein [Parafilimonas terrae]